jgi:hypothetical protein
LDDILAQHQSHMNINDVLIRVLKKDEQISQQTLHRNEEEKHPPEIIAREARDREYAEKLQKEWEEEHGLGILAEKFWKEKHALEVRDREIAEKFQKEEEERWHSDKFKEIEKETKLELESLRVAAELEKKILNWRLMKAEEEIAQLKRALAPREDNRRCNKIQAQSSSRLFFEFDEDEEGDFIANEEERLVPLRRLAVSSVIPITSSTTSSSAFAVSCSGDALGSRFNSIQVPNQFTNMVER